MANTFRSYLTQVGSTSSDIFSVGNSRTSRIASVVVSNYSGGDETVTFHIYPSGGSPADSNIVVNLKSVSSGDQRTINELINVVLSEGDTLSVTGSADNAMNVRVSILERF